MRMGSGGGIGVFRIPELGDLMVKEGVFGDGRYPGLTSSSSRKEYSRLDRQGALHPDPDSRLPWQLNPAWGQACSRASSALRLKFPVAGKAGGQEARITQWRKNVQLGRWLCWPIAPHCLHVDQ